MKSLIDVTDLSVSETKELMDTAKDIIENPSKYCEACKGKRYNRDTLDVHYKGKSIFDVLDMTVEEAIVLFKGPLKQWVAEHDGQMPSLDSPNLQEKELAQAFTIIKNLKIRKMMGLEYEE